MLPLVQPFLPPKGEVIPALENILYSGYIAEGEPVYEFEDQFGAFIGNNNVLAVHSGTDALHIALILAGIKSGDEVISTAMTAEPTNIAIAMVGAKVIWGDVDENTGLLDPNSVRELITEKTKAIVVVHYAGMVCDMDEFNKISQEFGLPIIEDAAHALGSQYQGKKIGGNSAYTIFSLQAIKHITTVDGGFLSFKTDEQLTRARKMRWFGLDKKKSRLENDITEVGYKYAMNNVNATIGLVQMRYINQVLETFISNGQYFDKALVGIEGISLIPYSANTLPSYWLYTMKVKNRDSFIELLAANNISASPLHYRNDNHSVFLSSKRDLPALDKFYSELVHIPCGWWVGTEDREHIIEIIKKGW